MTNKPRIIIWDLETLPDWKEVLKSYVGLSNWRGLTMKASLNSIICFGWKELDGKRTHCDSVWDFSDSINDDRALCEHIYKVLSEADGIITQNGKKFDLPFLQTRLLKHGLPPLPPIKHVDTKILMKRNLFLYSNSLDYAGKFFLNEGKVDHDGWELWCRVYDGDSSAKKLMEKYCKGDVLLLEKLYKKLLRFSKSGPNFNLFHEEKLDYCSNCGSASLMKWGYYYSATKRLQRYRCNDCHSLMQGSKNLKAI